MVGAALGVASLVASGIKGVIGGIQGIGGARKQAALWRNRPLLGITAGEKANDQLYGQLASSVSMPGQQQYEDKLGQTYAEGVSDINKTSISSLGATQGAIDLSGKKMQAIQDLSGAFAEYKYKAMQNLGQWNNQKTNLEQQRFDVNQMQPWGAKMNEAVGQKQAGFQSFGSGVDSGLGMLGDLAGTEQLMKMYQDMYEGGGSAGQRQFQMPRGYNSQQNLMNTLSGKIHGR